MNGLNRYDRKTGTFKRYHHQPENAGSLSHNHVHRIIEDRKGNLWVGTSGGGLNLFDPKTESFIHFRHKSGDPASLGNDVILDLYVDRNDNLWIGTENGGLNLYNPKTAGFSHYVTDNTNKSAWHTMSCTVYCCHKAKISR